MNLLKLAKANLWQPLLIGISMCITGSAFAADLGRVSDHGQLSVSGSKIVNEAGEVVQLRGMSSHALTAEYPFRTDGPTPIPEVGQAAGLYTTKETIQWTRDHWGANAFRAAMYVEGWGVADPRNWQYSTDYYVRNAANEIVRDTSASQLFDDISDFKDEPGRLHYGYMQKLFKVIDWAIELDMYVIVDWHVLEDVPEDRKYEAKMFFELVSKEYPNNKNIIYELANEPTDKTEEITEAEYNAAKPPAVNPYDKKVFAYIGETQANGKWKLTDIGHLTPEWPERSDEWITWPELKTYAEEVLPFVRANSSNALAIIGTPIYSQEIDDPISDRLADGNVLYSFHFYACTHLSIDDGTDQGDGTDQEFWSKDTTIGVFQKVQQAVAAGLPIISSEWGTVQSSGQGATCPGQTKGWIDYLNANDISWFNWSMSGKDERNPANNTDNDPDNDYNPTDVTLGASTFEYNIPYDFVKTAVGFPANYDVDGDDPYLIPDTVRNYKITDIEDEALQPFLQPTGKLVRCLMNDDCDEQVQSVAACNFDTTIQPHVYSRHWQGQIAIENTSSQATSEWEVIVQLAPGQVINDAWGQNIQNIGTGRYRISSQPWNGVIPAGQSLTFGMHGNVGPADESVGDVVLSGDTCGEPVAKTLLLDESIDGNTFYYTLPIANFFNGTDTPNEDIIATIDGVDYSLEGIFCCRGSFFMHQNGITLGEHSVKISTPSGSPSEVDDATFTFSNAKSECTIESFNEWNEGGSEKWMATIKVHNKGYKLGTNSGYYSMDANTIAELEQDPANIGLTDEEILAKLDQVESGKDWSVRLQWIENYPSLVAQVKRGVESMDGKTSITENTWLNGNNATEYSYTITADQASRTIAARESVEFQIKGTGLFSLNNSQYDDKPYVGCSFGQLDDYQQ
jgi:hypothetical protein